MKKWFLALVVIILFTSCERKPIEKVPVTIEMKLVDGSWVTHSYKLSKDYKLSIGTYYGSYYLECYGDDGYSIVKNGVIDYKVVKRNNK